MNWLSNPWLALIDGSDSEKTSFHAFASDAIMVLDDNRPPFFKGYTDHGTKHIRGVLDKARRLVPPDIWADDELIGAAEASAFVTATLLHDLGMHLSEEGFVKLVSRDTVFKPLPWFKNDQVGRRADTPWPVLWKNYLDEVCHMSVDELISIVGPGLSPGLPPVAVSTGKDLEPDTWGNEDKALIGEFLRRHHPRLAHEIALYGMPGMEGFPVLAEGSGALADRADLIGTIARSHGESIRALAPYLEDMYIGGVRPLGILATYWMAVLRIADYLELEAERAPALLKELRHITSPVSLQEWEKHKAVISVGWDSKDTQALELNVAKAHSLQTNIALNRTIADVQRELDVSAAVLSETYGAGQIQLSGANSGASANLRLTKYRVRSNLQAPAFQASLPFVPGEFRLSNAEDLFRRVVRNLYGERPEVGVRELVQNAVDAVRAREALSSSGYLANQGKDLDEVWGVTIKIEQSDSGEGVSLSVIDQGVGMDADVVRDQFLRVGASHSPAKYAGALKTGQFGIGALAGFLIGPMLEVKTRSASEKSGLSFTSGLSGSLIELVRCDIPVGTSIQVECEMSIADAEGMVNRALATYSFEGPPVTLEVDAGGGDLVRKPTLQPRAPMIDWREIDPKGTYEAARWKPDLQVEGAVAHNGFWVGQPESDYLARGKGGGFGSRYEWEDPWLDKHVRCPAVSVEDPQGVTQLSLDRYSLMEPHLPIEGELAQAIGEDAAALGWAIGPSEHPLGKGDLVRPIRVGDDWTLLSPEIMRNSCDRVVVIQVEPGTPQLDAAMSDASQSLGPKTGILMSFGMDTWSNQKVSRDINLLLDAGTMGSVATRNLKVREPAETPEGWVVVKRPSKRKKGGSRELVEAWANVTLKNGSISRDGHHANQLARDFKEPIEMWSEVTGSPAIFSVFGGWRNRTLSDGEKAFSDGWVRGAGGHLIPMGDESRLSASRRRGLNKERIEAWDRTYEATKDVSGLGKDLQSYLGRDRGW